MRSLLHRVFETKLLQPVTRALSTFFLGTERVISQAIYGLSLQARDVKTFAAMWVMMCGFLVWEFPPLQHGQGFHLLETLEFSFAKSYSERVIFLENNR